MLSSSFLTQRLRDKAIAQQVQQKTQSGKPIIIPQAGYGSYTISDVDNGSINGYNKVQGGCVTVNPSCNCPSVPYQSPDPDIILITIFVTYNSSVEIYIELKGNGIVEWGDGTSTAFNTSNVSGYTHTYYGGPCSAGVTEEKTIKITGFTSTLKLSPSVIEESSPTYIYPGNFPDSRIVSFIKADYLQTFIALTGSISTVNNFQNAVSLLNIQISGSDLDLSTASGSQFDSLTQLETIYLRKVGNVTLNSSNEFVNVFPNATALLIEGVGIGTMTGIDTLYTSNPKLQVLSLSNNSNISLTNIPTLPSTLLQFTAFSTSLNTSPTPLPSGLQILNLSSSPITTLPSLPSTLLRLILNDTPLTSIPTLPINLIELQMYGVNLSSNMGSLSNLPASLQILGLSGAQLTLPLPINFAIQTPILKELYLDFAFSSTLSTFNSDFPSNLEILNISYSLITDFAFPFPSSLISLTFNNNNYVNTFSISNCTNLKNADLSYLGIDATPQLNDLGIMPNSLESLRISFCVLTTFPTLTSTNLKELYADSIVFSNPLPSLPNTLTALEVSYSNITDLPNPLPSSLIDLSMNTCQDILSLPSDLLISLTNLKRIKAIELVLTQFPDIPPNVTELYLASSTSASILPSNIGSTNLLTLDLANTPINSINSLPSTLQFLNLTDCTALTDTSFPSSFPNTLKILYIQNNDNITVLPSLANTQLTDLYLSNLRLLDLIPALPSTILYIYATNGLGDPSYQLRGFTDTTFESTCLRFLDISRLPNLTSGGVPIPILPDSLEALYMFNCPLLDDTNIPTSWPTSLFVLEISINNNITQLPSLANTQLQYLGIYNMPALIYIPNLPSTISNLSAANNGNIPSYSLIGFSDSSLAFTQLGIISLFNMNNPLFMSPFPNVPNTLGQFDIGGGDPSVFTQTYVDNIAQNIVDNVPFSFGIFNASGLSLSLSPPLQTLQNTYNWNVII
jgi:hypothetical protein